MFSNCKNYENKKQVSAASFHTLHDRDRHENLQTHIKLNNLFLVCYFPHNSLCLDLFTNYHDTVVCTKKKTL